MTRTLIVGAGGFGREVWAWAMDAGANPAGFLDDSPAALEGFPSEGKILGAVSSYEPQEDDRLLIAIGDPSTRLRIAAELDGRGARFATLVHPTAILGQFCGIGEGSILCPRVTLTTNVQVGKHVHLNVGCSIGHDAVIEDGCTLSGHVVLTGRTRLERGAFLGTSACTLPGANVGELARVGAASVVLRRVPSGTTVMGVPARKIG